MSDRKQRISCEFFPPKTEAGKTTLLNEVTPVLNALGPEFFSVTYGAGGSTRDTTLGVVSAIRELGIDVAPHLSFGGDDENAVADLLETYRAKGVKRLVALRGDIPLARAAGHNPSTPTSWSSLFVRPTGDHFHIEVAAYPEIHPEAKSYDSDIRYLKGKFDAGADSGITQYFTRWMPTFIFWTSAQPLA